MIGKGNFKFLTFWKLKDWKKNNFPHVPYSDLEILLQVHSIAVTFLLGISTKQWYHRSPIYVYFQIKLAHNVNRLEEGNQRHFLWLYSLGNKMTFFRQYLGVSEIMLYMIIMHACLKGKEGFADGQSIRVFLPSKKTVFLDNINFIWKSHIFTYC